MDSELLWSLVYNLLARQPCNKIAVAFHQGKASASASVEDINRQIHVFRSILKALPAASSYSNSRYVQCDDVGRLLNACSFLPRHRLLILGMKLSLAGSIVSSKAGIDALASAGFEDGCCLSILRYWRRSLARKEPGVLFGALRFTVATLCLSPWLFSSSSLQSTPRPWTVPAVFLCFADVAASGSVR